MSNLEKYEKAFKDALEISDDTVLADLEYQKIKTWDSIGHMGLISELEDAFDIEIPDEDAEELRTVGDIVSYIEANI